MALDQHHTLLLDATRLTTPSCESPKADNNVSLRAALPALERALQRDEYDTARMYPCWASSQSPVDDKARLSHEEARTELSRCSRD